jgi:hypothetical protein
MAGEKKYYSFIDSGPFDRRWKALDLDDDEHAALEDTILADPVRPPVVSGTDGLRKIRFAPRRWKTGKRGAVRVCYVFYPRHNTIALLMVFAKNEKDDLTAAEKRELNRAIRRIDEALAKFSVKPPRTEL